ncbi:hypothetical protein AAFF_G00186450 [Aldrovandia affinis]|uniref:Protein FAM131A n=1 Tax=Aldrovandia affinis TaxID=143900 RepID=A0AAD7SYJ3_9TELE|nr:hypothetical protein AAFF_G00186450 [Aldrovandia affinis]
MDFTPLLLPQKNKVTRRPVDSVILSNQTKRKSEVAGLFSPLDASTSISLRNSHRESFRGRGREKGLRVDEVNVEDTDEMLPKSRRALTIQEIAALARSSLHGISQVVKDHVTKPTAMAQGRVAHLIEWKGWSRPTDSPTAPESDFNSYSDLSEGEQEARFAAGVAEQFAIAEAKLRAWSSVDGEDSNDDSYDEDFPAANEPPLTTPSTDVMAYPYYLRDLLQSQVCQQLAARTPCEPDSSAEPSPAGGSPDTLCSSLCSLEDHPLLRELGCPPASSAELAAKILGSLQGGEELLAWLQRAGGDCPFRSLGRGPGDDSSFSVSYSESFLSPGQDDDLHCKDYDSVCRDELLGAPAAGRPGSVRRSRSGPIAHSAATPPLCRAPGEQSSARLLHNRRAAERYLCRQAISRDYEIY